MNRYTPATPEPSRDVHAWTDIITPHIESLQQDMTPEQDLALFTGLATGYSLRQVAASMGIQHQDAMLRWVDMTQPIITRGRIEHDAQLALGNVLRGRVAG